MPSAYAAYAPAVHFSDPAVGAEVTALDEAQRRALSALADRHRIAFLDCTPALHAAVLRGDLNRIVVGHHSNVQDNAVLHLADDLPCLVGHWVTVGHGAIGHACTVGDEVLVGMGAKVLGGARVGADSVVVANGAWARQIGGLPDLPVRPVKGQILRLDPGRLPAPTLTIRAYSRGQENELVPRET